MNRRLTPLAHALIAFFAICAVSALAGLLVACASGQCPGGVCPLPSRPNYASPWQQSPARPTAVPTAMDIRVECPTARGSGTSIARRPEGGTLIVTNYHVIRNQARVIVYSGNGGRAIGRVAMVDRPNDLALIAINQSWPVAKMGDSIQLGTRVQFRAYDAGVRFRKYSGTVRGEYSEQGAAEAGYFATGASVQGNSGGGVFFDGRLVGVIWGNPEGQTAFIRIGPVRRLIARVLGRELPIRGCPPMDNPSPMLSPEIPLPGQVGPIGPVGPQGPAGLPGRRGESTDVSVLVDRMSAIETRFNNLPPITFNQIDATTGEVLDTEQVSLGGTLALRFGSKNTAVDSRLLGLGGGVALSIPFALLAARKLDG